jgi:5-methylcytosine-specific restriction endonuclease McrA
MRREFSAAVKFSAFERADGKCQRCTAYLYAGRFHFDHVLPDALGGEPTLDNCEVLCLNCHGEKTAKHDVPRIAKAKRQKARHIGAKASRTPMPGGKRSKWKRKISGEVVPR